MAEVGSKDPLTRRVYQSYIGAVRRRLQVTAQRYPGARHRLRICGRGAYLRRDRTETGMVNAVLNQLARRAAGGVCLIPTSRYSCAFHLAANVSHSAMYFWFGIGPSVMALSI